MANKPRDDDHVTLSTIKDGAAVELFDAALEEVLKNIEDPNFKAKAKRGIRLDFVFDVDESRELGAVHIEVDTKLAKRNPASSVVHFGRRQGVLVAVEYDPRQRNIFDPDQGADITPFRQVEAGGKTEEADDD